MKACELLQFMHRIETLKTNPRHCVTAAGIPETVAAHSWRTAAMALLLTDEFPQIDMNKVIRMCLIHDFGEAVTGDIPTFEKTADHEAAEWNALQNLLGTLPPRERDSLTALFQEMNEQKTLEARFYKALDKLEAVIQHNESDISTWLPLEYELNRTYATENAAEFPFLKELRKQMLLDTEQKIKEAQKE